MLPRPKVAVTGASGFVGRHVLQSLSARTVDVTATFNRQSPDSHSDVQWVKLDLGNPPEEAFSALGEPDIVIHLAWSELSNYRSDTHLRDELQRQKRFLSSLIDGGLENLVITGTCFEYGLKEGELTETLEPAPHLPYPQAKDALRREIEAQSAAKAVTFSWLRLFYLFGDGQPERTLYSQFQRAVQDKQPSFDMSPGDQQRDYLHVRVVAEIICDLALQKRDLGIVNICSGEPVTVRSLVEGWRDQMGSDIALNLGHYPYPDWEPTAFWGSPVKLRSLLGGS